MFKTAPLIISAFMLAASFGTSLAAEELLVNTDETQVVHLPAKPGTLVIGNPSIVDATMESGNVFIQGKSFGSTNMIILDTKGKEIANYAITVRLGGNNNVALYKAGDRFSYTCAPLCQEAIQVGDPHKWTAEIITLSEGKSNLAKGISNQDSNGNGGGAPPPNR